METKTKKLFDIFAPNKTLEDTARVSVTNESSDAPAVPMDKQIQTGSDTKKRKNGKTK